MPGRRPAPRACPAPASFVALPPTPDDDLGAPCSSGDLEQLPDPPGAGQRRGRARRRRAGAARSPGRPRRRRCAARRARPQHRGRHLAAERVADRGRPRCVPPRARASTSRKPGPPSDSGSSSTSSCGRPARPALRHRRGRLDGAERRAEGVRGDEDAHAVRLSVSRAVGPPVLDFVRLVRSADRPPRPHAVARGRMRWRDGPERGTRHTIGA